MQDSFQILKLAEHSCVEYFYASIAIILHSSFSTIKALQPMSRYISLDSVYTIYCYVSVYIYYYYLHRRFIYSTSRFVCACLFDLFFCFEQKNQILKHRQTMEKNRKPETIDNVSQTKHDVEYTQSWQIRTLFFRQVLAETLQHCPQIGCGDVSSIVFIEYLQPNGKNRYRDLLLCIFIIIILLQIYRNVYLFERIFKLSEKLLSLNSFDAIFSNIFRRLHFKVENI